MASYWLLRLVPDRRWGRWICGTIIFGVVFGLFATLGVISDESLADRSDIGVALFFASLFAYIIPIHHLIIHRSLAALDQLTPYLENDADLADHYRHRIQIKPLWWQGLVLLGGLGAGIIHNALLLNDETLMQAIAEPDSILSLVITLGIWIVMTAAIASLIENAVLFKQLAERVKVDVFNTRALTPFGSVAVSSTLAMIGAQAAFPLLIAGSDSHWITFAPGLVATGLPMIFLFLLPVLPVHRRVTGLKKKMLAEVNADISVLSRETSKRYEALEPLLVYRREVLNAPEWPFDTGAVGRLALYLIIPPLTWVGAALIEIVVDTAI
jgi:hypothetical protein